MCYRLLLSLKPMESSFFLWTTIIHLCYEERDRQGEVRSSLPERASERTAFVRSKDLSLLSRASVRATERTSLLSKALGRACCLRFLRFASAWQVGRLFGSFLLRSFVWRRLKRESPERFVLSSAMESSVAIFIMAFINALHCHKQTCLNIYLSTKFVYYMFE